MARLTVEDLEGRDVMSAGVTVGIGSVPLGQGTAVMTELEEFAGAAVSLVSPRDQNSGGPTGKLTAPLGSTKGSVAGGQDPAAIVVGFTPPIGSNKGSLTSGIAGDGLGTTTNFAGDAYDNEMGVQERVAFPANDASSKDAAYLRRDSSTQGIIAVLIGL